MKSIGLISISLLVLFLNCNTKKSASEIPLSLDLNTVSDSVVLFGENVISTPMYERDIAIAPQGDELIYTLADYKQTRRALVTIKKVNGQWQQPEILNISGKYHDIEPFYANDGKRLFFASNRPIYGDDSRNDYNIWFSEREDNGWGEPEALDSIINTKGDEYFPSLSTLGNLYFTATRQNGVGREDIFISKFEDSTYQSPEPLPAEINTGYYEFNAFISPTEDFIIFSSYGRPDDFGGGDLYISRKDDKGNWTIAKNLGSEINSNKLDYCPFVDMKSNSFYFTSEKMDLNQTDLESIHELDQIANNPFNGFGNIFRVGFDRIDKSE